MFSASAGACRKVLPKSLEKRISYLSTIASSSINFPGLFGLDILIFSPRNSIQSLLKKLLNGG